VDVAIRLGDIGFSPMRSRPNDDAVLDRTEFRTHVVTNAQGFRERRPAGAKPPGVMRIVVVGDSFTQGYGVEEDEAYPRVLERLLDARDPQRRHEVINLGVPGACTLDYLPNLREFGLPYQPDLVVVGLMANDVHDLYSLRRYGGRILPQILRQVQERIADDRPAWKRLPSRLWPTLYEYAGERLRSLRAPAATASASASVASAPARRQLVPDERWEDVLLEVAARYGRRAEVEAALPQAPPALLAAIRPVLTGEYQFDLTADETPLLRLDALLLPRSHIDMVILPADHDAAWAEAMSHLRRIDSLARRAGATTLVAYIPASTQVNDAGWRLREELGFEMDPQTLTDTRIVDRLREFGAAADVRVVDLLTPLRARAKEPIYFPIDGHWTPLGHRIAAEVLAAAIAP
jgi:lysophospholipase L1-like esterase